MIERPFDRCVPFDLCFAAYSITLGRSASFGDLGSRRGRPVDPNGALARTPAFKPKGGALPPSHDPHTRAPTPRSRPSLPNHTHTQERASERRMLSTLARRPVAAAAALRNGASSSQVGVGALRCLCVRRDGGSQGERDDVCVAWGAMGTSCASHTCVGSQWHRSRSTVSPQPPPPSHAPTHPHPHKHARITSHRSCPARC